MLLQGAPLAYSTHAHCLLARLRHMDHNELDAGKATHLDTALCLG